MFLLGGYDMGWRIREYNVFKPRPASSSSMASFISYSNIVFHVALNPFCKCVSHLTLEFEILQLLLFISILTEMPLLIKFIHKWETDSLKHKGFISSLWFQLFFTTLCENLKPKWTGTSFLFVIPALLTIFLLEWTDLVTVECNLCFSLVTSSSTDSRPNIQRRREVW